MAENERWMDEIIGQIKEYVAQDRITLVFDKEENE